MPIATKKNKIIISPILLEIASKAFVIKGSSAPALTNCPTTWGKTNASLTLTLAPSPNLDLHPNPNPNPSY